MQHFVCTGDCGGTSETAGLCQAPTCSQTGSPLMPCECEDNLHGKEAEEQS